MYQLLQKKPILAVLEPRCLVGTRKCYNIRALPNVYGVDATQMEQKDEVNMNKAMLTVDVNVGDLALLFQPRGENYPDILLAFVKPDEQWSSLLHLYMSQTSSPMLDVAMRGKGGKLQSAGYSSMFHEPLVRMTDEAFDAQVGGAVFARGDTSGGKAPDYVFQDVVWGVFQNPTHIRSATAKALVLSGKQTGLKTRVVMPLYGTAVTVLQTRETKKSFNAQGYAEALAYVEGQVQGLYLAARQLETPVHVSLWLPSQNDDNRTDWVEMVGDAIHRTGLRSLAAVNYS